VVINNDLFYQSSHVEGADGKQPWTKLSEPLPHAFDLFLGAVAGKKDVPLVSPAEAAARSAVMEALYTAAKVHRWVAPKCPRKAK
jgi:predicted dehydrogenase